MGLVMVALLGLASAQDADAERIDRLVRDLGSAEFSVRKEADDALRRIGKPAIPALKKAVEDPDPERSMRARMILKDLERAPSTPAPREQGPRTGTRVTVRMQNGDDDISFDLYPDGRVELKVRESDGKGGTVERTYKAESMEAFRKQHPDLAKKYSLDQYLPGSGRFGRLPRRDFRDGLPPGLEGFEEFFRDFEKRFEGRGRPFQFRWTFPPRGGEQPQGVLPAPKGPELGVLISPIDPVLADQLELPAGQGFTITEVKPGSTAERAGLQRYDVLVGVEGNAPTDIDTLGRVLRERLNAGTPFSLTIIRQGKRRTVRIVPLQ